MDIPALIDRILPQVVELRREFHAHPELSEQEVWTENRICQVLDEVGIPYEAGVAGHGVVAWLEGKGAPNPEREYQVIGIRADMDALPVQELSTLPFASKMEGVMHACGHDIHTAVALGSAMALKQLEGKFSGTVKFFFQPAEETIGGAERMIQAGCLEHPSVDGVIGLHIAPNIPVGQVEFVRGKMNAASAEWYMTVEGVSCHGAHPDDGIDPIVVGAAIVTALQTISSRRHAPTEPVIVTVGSFHAGTAGNVIPQEAHMKGIIRALDLETRTAMKNQLKTMAEGIALAHGAKAHVTFKDSYPSHANHRGLGDLVEGVAREILPDGSVVIGEVPNMGADDFAYFSQATHGCYFNIGTKGEEQQEGQVLHSPYIEPHEDCIKVGLMVEVAAVMKLLGL